MPLQIPHPTTPLHLYRHLLRESTYLPRLCRPWITSRIQQRFRDCRRSNSPVREIKEAHSSLQYIRSANAGHIHRLQRLCLMATGRVGKRRRILAASQLSPGPPADDAELAATRPPEVTDATDATDVTGITGTTTTAHAPAPGGPDWLDNWSLDMVAALAKSQLSQQASDWPQTMRRVLDPKYIMEGRNAFGHPYNSTLRRNKLKRHWAGVLKQLMPPLPRGEWDHLASVVKGEANISELRIPPRRPVAQSAEGGSPASASEQWDWSQHVLKPGRVVERGNSRKRKTLTGMEDQDPRGPGRPIGVRVIHPRKLQRLYGRIWKMTPIMKQKPKSQTWAVSWGEEEQKISTPSTGQLVFFEGVTKDGRMLPKA
ncbi:hypothetical protein F4859DRAFT_231016 [Xylaria cf. heliscus]|nr:hypothetical protein F4859DRAFT_231016 [Xylaria cf. heliscus]